ncbi:hypothetical protein ABZS71_06690 [Streptomyces sp. NPDC005393]|uniref:hypothetical protein n=1 Tax=Streptomyces sp. NPDC005393 TaxID=3157041 RepID=UPI0033BE7374
MTRLTDDTLASSGLFEVLTTTDMTHAARLVWAYLATVADPQRQVSIALGLGVDQGTVSRSVTALAQRGLARKINGVWVAERPGDEEED